MGSLTVPVKCSTVRTFNNLVTNLNYILFVIYCIVSSVYFILCAYKMIKYNGSLAEMGLFLGGYLGIMLLGTGLIIYGFEWFKWMVNHLPELKCIED